MPSRPLWKRGDPKLRETGVGGGAAGMCNLDMNQTQLEALSNPMMEPQILVVRVGHLHSRLAADTPSLAVRSMQACVSACECIQSTPLL